MGSNATDQEAAPPDLMERIEDASTQASLSWPSNISYHAVEDGELERLMKIEKPAYFGVAVGALGLLGGAVPEAIGAISAVMSGQPIDLKAMAFLMVASASLTAMIISGVVAYRGKDKALEALEAIRQRPKISLPPGHPAAPPYRQ